MLRSPTVRDDGTGSAVLVKHATGAECSRLRHEADLLNTIRDEGVVTPVGFDESADRCELRLQYLEAATLIEHPPLGFTDVLDVLIALGNTVADLHQRGIRHGALSRDHVLLARPLRPVLCGFGDATGPADPQKHPPEADLGGIAAIAEAELTRTDRAVASAAERRGCGDALSATRDLAAAAAEAPHDSAALQTWISRLGAIRHPANPAPFDVGVRGHHLTPEREPSRRDLRRMATPAAAIALVIVVIASWRVLSGGEPATQTASSLRPANVPIGSSTSTVAAEFGTLDPDGTGLIEPDADSTSRASPPTTLSTDDSTGSRVTLLYGTARPECSEAGTPQSADGEAADIDCAEPSSAAVPDHGPDADLLTLPSGQWALMDGDDLPRLSCDVVVLHYGDLSIESGQPAAAAPQGDASE